MEKKGVRPELEQKDNTKNEKVPRWMNLFQQWVMEYTSSLTEDCQKSRQFEDRFKSQNV